MVSRAGLETIPCSENTQVSDSMKRLNRQNRDIRRTEVHGGYTEALPVQRKETIMPGVRAACRHKRREATDRLRPSEPNRTARPPKRSHARRSP
jgi:hypothetical protein